MTTEENSELITQILNSMAQVVLAEGRNARTLVTVTDTLLNLTERVLHLERMMGLRK